MLRRSNFPRTQGRRVDPRAGDQAHAPHMEAIADAALDGTRTTLLTTLSTVPLLIIDDLGLRKLPHTAAGDRLEWGQRSGNRRVPRTGVCSQRDTMATVNLPIIEIRGLVKAA